MATKVKDKAGKTIKLARIVIDDLRTFPSDVEAEYAKTSEEGIELLSGYLDKGLTINELWLDYDLGGDDTMSPVVDFLAERAFYGETPLDIQRVYIHTSNPSGALTLGKFCIRWGLKYTIIDPNKVWLSAGSAEI